MIVKFSTRAGALTMHGDAAVTLIRAMGHSGTVPGANLAAELPEALARLKASSAARGGEPMPPPGQPVARDEDDRDAAEREPTVTLRMRALPLIEMIETALARDSDLMWERG
jgi:hypothetical protein